MDSLEKLRLFGAHRVGVERDRRSIAIMAGAGIDGSAHVSQGACSLVEATAALDTHSFGAVICTWST